MKDWKFTEQLRDLVLLLTLVGVGYLALKSCDTVPAGENARMRGMMEQRMKRGSQDRVGPEGPWWRQDYDVDSKPSRGQRGERKQRPERSKKKERGSAGDGEAVKVY
tara:strand:- start:117 stop:437 length:321 start_codon:yes stop_codon:yes gene_type:complete